MSFAQVLVHGTVLCRRGVCHLHRYWFTAQCCVVMVCVICTGTGSRHSAVSSWCVSFAQVLVRGTVLCRRGVLMLTSDNVTVYGGEVDSLLETSHEHRLSNKLYVLFYLQSFTYL